MKSPAISSEPKKNSRHQQGLGRAVLAACGGSLLDLFFHPEDGRSTLL